MLVTTVAGYSAGAPNELAVVAHRRGYERGSAPPCLVLHGASGSAREPLVLPYGTGWAGEGPMKELAERDLPVMSADWGGSVAWASELSIDTVDDGYEWFTTPGAAKPTTAELAPALVYGASMGAATAVRWAVRNPELVERMALAIPALDWGWLFDNFANHATNMTAAWGSRAAAVAQQPLTIAHLLPPVPVEVWFASDDEVYPTGQAEETVAAFVDACPGEVVVHELGAVGHTVQTVPSREVAEFLRP